MKRVTVTSLLSAVVLAGSLSTASAQATPRWLPLPAGRKAAPAKAQPVMSRSAYSAPDEVPAALNESSVELGTTEASTVSVAPPAGQAAPSQPMPRVHQVNSRNLLIDFALKGIGASGVGNVELWYTRNGQSWGKYPGGRQTMSPFVVTTTEDGLYGFTVVACDGLGVSKTHPQPGDPPHTWVDVDTSKPEVRLLNTEAGVDESGRTLTLHWSVLDRNLVGRPITLSYADHANGTWIPFATNLENNGYYTWRMSPGLPGRVLVRVAATDRAGNIGQDQSTMPAPVDSSMPTATIRNITRNGVIVPVGGR